MRMKLDINNSPLKLEIGELYPYKIELHIAFALMSLLLIASYGFSALIAWLSAISIFEIQFLFNFLNKKKSSSKKIERICLNPFGFTSNFYSSNLKMMQGKIYSTLVIFFITICIAINKFGLLAFLTFNSNQTFITYCINSLLVISFVNLLPTTNTIGYFSTKKFLSYKYSKDSIYLNYLPAILLVVISIEAQNILLLISTLSILLYSSSQRFKSKAIEAGETIKIEEVHTSINDMHKIEPTTLVRDALNLLIKNNLSISCVVKDSEFKGLITKDILLDNLSENLNETVESILFNVLEEITIDEKLEKAFKIIDESDLKVIKVNSDGKLVGFIFRDVLYEFMLVNNMIEKLDKTDDLFSDDLF